LRIHVFAVLAVIGSIAATALVAELRLRRRHDRSELALLEQRASTLAAALARDLRLADEWFQFVAPELALTGTTDSDVPFHSPAAAAELPAGVRLRWLARDSLHDASIESQRQGRSLGAERDVHPLWLRIRTIHPPIAFPSRAGLALELDLASWLRRYASAANENDRFVVHATIEDRSIELSLPATERSARRTPHADAQAPLLASRRFPLGPTESRSDVWIQIRTPHREPPLPGLRDALELVGLCLICGGLAAHTSSQLARRLRSEEQDHLNQLNAALTLAEKRNRALERTAETRDISARILRVQVDQTPLEELLVRVLDEFSTLPGLASPGRLLIYTLPRDTARSEASGRLGELGLTAQCGAPPETLHVSEARIEELCRRAVHFNIPITEPGSRKGGVVSTPGAAVPLRAATRMLGALYADMAPPSSGEVVSGDALAAAAESLAHLIDRSYAYAALQGSLAELEEARLAAVATTRRKDEFLAHVSHQLRTPLTSILGFAQFLLEEDQLGGEEREAVSVIRSNGEQLLEMISELVGVALIEPVSSETSRGVLDPIAFTDTLVRDFAPRARERGLEIRNSHQLPRGLRLEVDEERLRAALAAALIDAIDGSEWGVLTLHTRLDDTRHVHFELSSPRVLTPVAGASTATEPQLPGGTRAIVQALGGDIRLTTGVKGTVLDLVIPASPLSHPQKTLRGETAPEEPGEPTENASSSSVGTEEEPLPDLTGYRLLLAEDNEVNQLLFTRILEAAGARVEVVGNGADAAHAALATLESKIPFDVVLMDIVMPVLDGAEATRRLREAGYSHPILALTASEAPADHQRCLAAGCDAVRTKPVSRVDLLRSVCELRTRPATGAS